MENNKSLYDAFVDSSPQGSLFHKSWWLDAVAPNQYTILSFEDKNGIAAAWPLVSKKVMHMKISMLPQLTPRLGIMFRPNRKLKYAEQLSEEMRLTIDLIELMPKHHFFSQHFNHQFGSWLPFYWKGFRQTTRYTYVIEDLSDLDMLWENIRSNTRRVIRKAIKQDISVITDLELHQLLDLNEVTFRRQGLPLPYSRQYVERIDAACKEHGARKMFFAVDSQNRLHAAAYIVYDQKSAYYLIGGGNPDLRNSQGQSLVLWEAIKFASTVSESFDFEGSMHSNIEPFFRGFGGLQKPYMEITRGSPFLNLGYSYAKKAWAKGGLMPYIIRKLLR